MSWDPNRFVRKFWALLAANERDSAKTYSNGQNESEESQTKICHLLQTRPLQFLKDNLKWAPDNNQSQTLKPVSPSKTTQSEEEQDASHLYKQTARWICHPFLNKVALRSLSSRNVKSLWRLILPRVCPKIPKNSSCRVNILPARESQEEIRNQEKLAALIRQSLRSKISHLM